MKLSDWARREGLSYKTAYRLFKTGQLPIASEQLATGTILVKESLPKTCNVVLYARVSSQNQKEDLNRQIQRLRDFAAAKGFSVTSEFVEIGSGLNGHRKQLIKILSNPAITMIIVEHRDRLARFGTEYIVASLEASGRSVVFVNDTECKDDLVQDMIDVLTSFCARLYGRRSARIKAEKAVQVITNKD